jgi:Holliday junction resolvase
MTITIKHPTDEKIFYIQLVSTSDAKIKIDNETKEIKKDEVFEFTGDASEINLNAQSEFSVTGVANFNWTFTLYSKK